MAKIIGIDLGTTNSVCAYYERREPQIIINEEGGRVTPSVVGISPNGERFVGDVAKRQLLINPESTIHSIKRFMGRTYKQAEADFRLVNYRIVPTEEGLCGVEIGGRVYSPQEISAMVLQKLRKSAEDFLGERVTDAVITVPAYFTDRQRQATKDAGMIAGLNVLRIINEPTAAALAYVSSRNKSAIIAVYDFGGGTFDISLLEVTRDVAEVRATRGNNTLGGADIDQVIVDWLVERFHHQHGVDVSSDKVVMQRLRDAAERAKKELSSALDTDIHLPYLIADARGPMHLQVNLSRGELERLAMPIFQQTINECRQALQDCNIQKQDIEEVVMVGGSSRIPMVQQMVQEFFGRPLCKSFNPDEVVAIGAAVQAGILEGGNKGITLLDVTNMSLGIEVEGHRFATLIPKNSTIPTQKTQLVSTVTDNQRVVKIHVLQGESKDARENVSLGEFELSGIAPAPRGQPRIEVKFAIDSSGIVSATARDANTGNSEGLVIQSQVGMSRTEVERLRDEAEDYLQRQGEREEVKSLRHQVEKQLVTLENFLRDNEGLLHKKDLFEIEQALKRGRMALLKNVDRANLDDLSVYLARFFAHLVSKTGGSTALH